MKLIFTALLTFLLTISIRSATCVSLGNGNWANAGTWSCGSVPGCGDSIVILAAHTVTITTQQDYTGCATGPIIVIYGVLKFDNGNKLKLPCNSRIYIMAGGTISPGTGGGNSNFIEICGDVLWTAADGNLNGPACLPPNAIWCMGVVLPVELVSFTGKAKDNTVELNWSTATEKNSASFDVERGTDAVSFTRFASINSKALNGNSNSILNYAVVDAYPLENISYYRLKQINKDNSFAYSNIVSVDYIASKNLKFTVYPNPNKGEFTADISGIENNHEVSITLKNDRGSMVYSSTFFIQDQNSSKLKVIPEHQLPSGVYICTLTLEGIKYSVKVVVI